ncbi:hypothetical protein Kpho02_36470 [Kitasatospora phosalacinea]|uniref:Uncharacterized protein n=1 Tax=Kitasatospora phosalacinea TaxID=2065 RepID=A0A9W6QAG1_9ACTN|nr:hypothetical protein [Kitasatospora phosalacinea]GLW71348.1 hypothetical protein Kpho02_36470 [Kitasatospora phosalacinea]
MPICPSCGAASADPAVTCANCGRPLAAPAIGDVIEGAGSAGTGPSPWGAGRVHHTRETPLLSRGWLTAGRVLIAPTALLLLAAVIGAASQDGSDAAGASLGWSAKGFQTWLTLALTAFGAPLTSRVHYTGKSSFADGTDAVSTSSTHLVMYLVALGWLLLLWAGLHLAGRARRRAGAVEPTASAAALQALRTGALSGAVALLLGWLAGHDAGLGGSLGSDDDLSMSMENGIALLPLTVSAALAAAALVLAVDGAAALRAEAARRGWLGSLLLAWQHASRVIGGLLVLLTAVALVVRLSSDTVFPEHGSGPLGMVTNDGLQLYGVGSGATALGLGTFGLHPLSFSLFDLGGRGWGWWLTVLPVLAAALALGWSAHRGRLFHRDRAVLAGLYAVLTAALLLGTSRWYDSSRTSPSGKHLSTTMDLAGWSLVSVLVSALCWGVFGALVVPAVLDALRRTRVPLAPPRPEVPPVPAVPPQPGALPLVQPVLPGQGGADLLERTPYGSVELVVDEPPAPAVALGKDDEDPHAAFRRPAAD